MLRIPLRENGRKTGPQTYENSRGARKKKSGPGFGRLAIKKRQDNQETAIFSKRRKKMQRKSTQGGNTTKSGGEERLRRREAQVIERVKK